MAQLLNPPPAPAPCPNLRPRRPCLRTRPSLAFQTLRLHSSPSPTALPEPRLSRSPSPQARQQPARTPQIPPVQPARRASPAPSSQSRASRTASTASSLSARSDTRPERIPSPLARDTRSDAQKVAFPSIPPPSDPSRIPAANAGRTSAHPPDVSGRTSSESARSSTQGRGFAPPTSPGPRPRAPSTTSLRAAIAARHPAPSNLRPRAETTIIARPPVDQGPEIIYSTDQRVGAASNEPPHTRAPSSMSLRPSFEQRPPMPPSTPVPVAAPSSDLDTKIGGEAGMAGVGRRGFAAAARAAMFTINHVRAGEGGPWSDISPVQGMDGRRANAPKFLDIASATKYGESSVNTPPLSAGSGTSSLSPHSPFSQSPVLNGLSSPNSRTPSNFNPTSPSSGPAIASSPTSPEGSLHLRDRVIPPSHDPRRSRSRTRHRLPGYPRSRARLRGPVAALPAEESEYGGLAYADSTADDEDDEDDKPLRASPLPLSAPAHVAAARTNVVRFPSVSDHSESKYTSSSSSSSSATARLPMRSLSQSTAASAYSARSAAKSTGALDRAMETLFEEDPTSPTSSATLFPQESQRDSKPPKLPVRSHTSPTLSTGRLDARSSKRSVKTRMCVRCERAIDDGRWIQMDGGSVLCDRCWKNMYLPKCRRCNLTIEKQAVSSSDGQLKGKYHRECFNCHTCHKPFPDKSFYVFDGKPFCAYHYHEANDSLCAAATCGQPIEGPCAVSHAGDRYHPEHLLCEYPRCAERLVEYYEVDGRMLCERHAQVVDDGLDVPEEELGARGESTRAMKRTTRFIDIAGLGGSALR
ncbi:Paxillin [Grifola frondosa]|uniref:Paxillin n=1 Tax=Grifola frondosa TaxID=5627 RepID=A0A1C7LX50_GRIFR|nr:Paxillin [Grifola frondosa]